MAIYSGGFGRQEDRTRLTDRLAFFLAATITILSAFKRTPGSHNRARLEEQTWPMKAAPYPSENTWFSATAKPFVNPLHAIFIPLTPI